MSSDQSRAEVGDVRRDEGERGFADEWERQVVLPERELREEPRQRSREPAEQDRRERRHHPREHLGPEPERVHCRIDDFRRGWHVVGVGTDRLGQRDEHRLQPVERAVRPAGPVDDLGRERERVARDAVAPAMWVCAARTMSRICVRSETSTGASIFGCRVSRSVVLVSAATRRASSQFTGPGVWSIRMSSLKSRFGPNGHPAGPICGSSLTRSVYGRAPRRDRRHRCRRRARTAAAAPARRDGRSRRV